MPPAPKSQHPVIFFDGVCGLCNAFVDFVMARDKDAEFRFAALQGETAAARLKDQPLPTTSFGEGTPPPDDVEGLRSVVLWDDDGLHRKSDAALRVLAGLGGIWSLARVLRLIPRSFRDSVYDFIARNRYRWFGKREACRLPTPSERKLFLP